MQYKVLSVYERINDKVYQFKLSSYEKEEDDEDDEYSLYEEEPTVPKKYYKILKKNNAFFAESGIYFERMSNAVAALDEMNAQELLKQLRK